MAQKERGNRKALRRILSVSRAQSRHTLRRAVLATPIAMAGRIVIRDYYWSGGDISVVSYVSADLEERARFNRSRYWPMELLAC